VIENGLVCKIISYSPTGYNIYLELCSCYDSVGS